MKKIISSIAILPKSFLVFLFLTIFFIECRNTEISKKSDVDPSGPTGFILGLTLQNFADNSPLDKPSDVLAKFVDSTRILIGTNKGLVFESTNGTSFTKNKKYSSSLGGCRNSSGGNGSDNCNIIGVGYEGNSYYLIGQKLNTNSSSGGTTVNTNKLYYLKTATLGTGTFSEILTGTSEATNPGFIVNNSILHLNLSTFSQSGQVTYKLFSSTDGSTWTNSGLSNPTCNLGSLYYDGTRVVCNINANFTGSVWQSATQTGLSSATSAGYVNSKYIAASNGIYELTAGTITGGTFTQRQSLSGLSPLYAPVYNSTIGKYVVLYGPSSSSGNTSINVTSYTSSDAATWTNSTASGLDITSLKAVYSFGNLFYLLGIKSASNASPQILLYSSSDGVTWTKLSNTGIQ